ncbi:hypothetical protein P12x_005298 [Tundrisphaera lichenicola]|uniref:hypothetical protein n=1 Tax=Tundrisphaera lichenicola TaxID=2029860 RepID=UPI003EC10AE0
MTRFFYTDPLAAAWMAKHFGMQLQYIEHYSDDSWYAKICHEKIVDIAAKYGFDSYELKEIHIHPDSLHLLEPQEGDYVDLHPNGLLIHNGAEFNDAFLKRESNWRIIQRNGIAFHWPESEAA